MKLNKYSWLAVLPMFFTACQEDTLMKEQQQDKIYTLSATMDGGAAMSRAQIVIGNDAEASAGETFMWNEKDAFTLYQIEENTLRNNIFTISDDYSETGNGDKTSADFYSYQKILEGKFTAIYPSEKLTFNTNENEYELLLQTELDFTQTTNDEAVAKVWKNYLRNNMFMIADGVYTDGHEITLTFKHLCCMARITYTNNTPNEQNIAELAFGGNQNFGVVRRYGNFLSDNQYVYNASNNDYHVKTNGLKVSADESVDLYVLFFPVDFNEGEMHLHVIDQNQTYKTVKINTSTIGEANNGAKGFQAGKRYWFKVTETTDGLVWTKDYTEGPADDEIIIIENQELSHALNIEYEIQLNDDGYAVMTGAEVKGYPELQLGWSDYTITSLSGIENFVNLETLGCAGVGLQECDLSQNKKLTYLDVSHNKLTSLDVSNNPALNNLSCSYNAAADDENDDYSGLSSLTLTNCSNLTHLSVEHTALQTLTIPNPSKLETLYLGNTNISFESFSLNGFTSLTGLDVDNMNLNDLSIIPDAMKDRLTWLYCDNNNLTSLDLTQYPLVTDLHCNDNDIETLTLTDTEFENSPLNSLYCMGNKMKALDITGTNISSLGCGKQQDGEFLQLTLSDKQKESWENDWKSSSDNMFVYLYDEEPEETITIENESFAHELKNQFGDNVILQDGKAIMTKSFVESKTELWFWGTEGLTTLEGIQHFTKLEKLVCVYHKLTSLDVSGLSSLKVLECWEGTLSTLDVTGCTALEEMYLQKNLLSTLDLTDCTKLVKLNCEDNKLTSLDLTTCTNNEIELYCGNQGQTAGEEITITIKLTDAMKAYWKSYLINLDNNQIRVVLDGDKSVTIPSLPKEEWD